MVTAPRKHDWGVKSLRIDSFDLKEHRRGGEKRDVFFFFGYFEVAGNRLLVYMQAADTCIYPGRRSIL